jgi:hypothetical protein
VELALHRTLSTFIKLLLERAMDRGFGEPSLQIVAISVAKPAQWIPCLTPIHMRIQDN